MFGYIVFIISLLFGVAVKKKYLFIYIYIILVLFAGLRFGIGSDYYQYLHLAMYYGDVREVDLIPSLFLYIAHHSSPYLFFFLSSIFIYYFFIYGLKYVTNSYISMCFFIGFPFFFFESLSIVRQAMAFSLVFYAYTRFYKRFFVQFLFVLVAILCHSSAIVSLLIFFPLEKLTRYSLLIILVSSFFFGNFLVNFLVKYMYDIPIFSAASWYLDNFDVYKGGTLVKYLLLVFSVGSIIFYQKIINKSVINKYYISLVIIGTSLYFIFSISPHLAMRICTFFFLGILVYIPIFFRCIGFPKSFQIAFCLLLFIMCAYTQHRTGVRDEDKNGFSPAYPYQTYLFK